MLKQTKHLNVEDTTMEQLTIEYLDDIFGNMQRWVDGKPAMICFEKSGDYEFPVLKSESR